MLKHELLLSVAVRRQYWIDISARL